MIKAVLLDMYGVIVRQTGDDFVPYVQKTFPALRAHEINTPWFKADAGEISSLDVWRILGYTGDLEAVERTYLETLELMEGVKEFLQAVHGPYKTAIISNDSSRWSRYVRRKFDLDRHFDAVSISGDLKIRKPDERIFRLTLEKLGVPAGECLYVDDRAGNLHAAGKLGMQTVQFGSAGAFDGARVGSFAELEAWMAGNQRLTAR